MKPNEFNWLTDKAKSILREYFDEISKSVSERLSKSSESYDNVADESFITGVLIEEINKYADERKGLLEKLKEVTGCYIDIKGWKNEKSAESKSGVDLGIVLTVSRRDIKLNKAVIVQSKKAYWEKDRIIYKELIKKEQRSIKGVKQARKMLSITPSSFFFLYNPSNILNSDMYNDIILRHFYKSQKMYNLVEELPYGYLDALYLLGLNLAVNLEKIYELKNKSHLGILVLPASRIVCIKRIDGSLETLLPACISFSDFMIDYFLSSFVGDTRKNILRKAGARKEFIDKIIAKHTVSIEAKIYE